MIVSKQPRPTEPFVCPRLINVKRAVALSWPLLPIVISALLLFAGWMPLLAFHDSHVPQAAPALLGTATASSSAICGHRSAVPATVASAARAARGASTSTAT